MHGPSSLSFALPLVLVSGLAAQPPCPPLGLAPHRPDPFLVLRGMDLTGPQQASVRVILGKYMAAQVAARPAAVRKERALMDALQDPSATEVQLRALNAEAGELRLKVLLDEHAALQEIQVILTPDQRAKAKNLRDLQRRELEAHQTVVDAMGKGSEGPEDPGGPACPGMPPRP